MADITAKGGGTAAVSEGFEVVFGQLVFQTQQRLNQTENAINNRLLNRPTFHDVVPTMFQVPAGKYGAGPTLVVTLRMTDRADADAIWADAVTRIGDWIDGTVLMQSSVVQDVDEGTSSATVIHLVHIPALPGDIP